MKNEMYKRPELKFVLLRNRENVAERCFPANLSDATRLYYDTSGKGFVGFYSNSCETNETLQNLVVFYYEKDETGQLINKREANENEIDQLIKALQKENLHNPNFSPFGETNIFSDTPGGMS